jgi:hypothetical protein
MSKLHVLVSFLTTSPRFAAEDLSSQLAEFAFYEDADGDDTPHTRTRSLSERQERDVRCLVQCLLLLSATIHSPMIQSFLSSFDQKLSLKYSHFCPMLFNWCVSLGFDKSKVLPSVAFCSDESQGYPTMVIAKHFGWSVTGRAFHCLRLLVPHSSSAGTPSNTARLAPPCQ